MYKKINKGQPNVFKPRRMVIGGIVHNVENEETLNKIKQEMQLKKEEAAKAAEEVKNQKILIKRTVSKNMSDIVTKIIVDPDTILTKEEKQHQLDKNNKYVEHMKKPTLTVKSNIVPSGMEQKNVNNNGPITIKTHTPKLIKKPSSNVLPIVSPEDDANNDEEQELKEEQEQKLKEKQELKEESELKGEPIVETNTTSIAKPTIEIKTTPVIKPVIETNTIPINKPVIETKITSPKPMSKPTVLNNNNNSAIKIISRKNIKPLPKNNVTQETNVEGTTILGGVVSSIFTKQDGTNDIPEIKQKPALTIKSNDKKPLNKSQQPQVQELEETTDNYFTKKYNVLSAQWYELIIKTKNKNDNSVKLLIKIFDDLKTQIINPIKITNDLFLHEKLPNNFVEYKIFLCMPINIVSIDIYIVGLKVYNTTLSPIDKQIVEQNIDLWKFRKLYDLEFINYYVNNADLEYSEKFIDRFKADYELYKNPNYFDQFMDSLTIPINNQTVVSDKTNILYLTHTSIEYEQYSYTIRTQQLLENFNKNDKYEIICATRYGYPFDRETGYYSQDLTREIEINGVKYIKLIKDKTSNFNTLNILKYLEQYIVATINLCISKNIKIIHATTNYWNGIVATNVSKYLGIKCIYELRELWNENIQLQKPEVINSDMIKMMSAQEKNIVNSVDKIIVLNKSQYKGNDKMEIIYDGANIDFKFKMSKNDLLDKHKLHDRIIIGYIGTLATYEGIENILKCIKLLNNDKIMFVIIGDGPYKNSMIDYIKTNNISENVLYLGKLKYENAMEYYQIIDMCIYPKKKCELHELKSSYKLIEAMAFKKPVIVSDLKAINEIINDGQNGLICIPDNVNDLLEKIKLLINNTELMNKLGAEAQKWTKKNRNWNAICNKMTRIYDNLMIKQNTSDVESDEHDKDAFDIEENNCRDDVEEESDESEE